MYHIHMESQYLNEHPIQPKDYYAILGVTQKSTQDDIRKAYKKLALLHHPDKSTGNRQRFEEIHEAYLVLSSAPLKSVYDSTLTCDDTPDELYDFFMTMLEVIQKQIASTKAHVYAKSTEKKHTRALDIHLNVHVTLEEVYNEGIKKVVTKVKRNGTWEKQPLYINLIDVQDTYVYKGKGDDNKGDIVIRLHIDEHPYIQRHPHHVHDLVIREKINMYEYVYGGEKHIPFFNNETLVCSIPPLYSIISHNSDAHMHVQQHSHTHIFKSHGLPYLIQDTIHYGDLHVHFDLHILFVKDVYDEYVKRRIVELFGG